MQSFTDHLDLIQIIQFYQRLEALTGIYYLLDDKQQVIYVGQTVNLYDRLPVHRDKVFTSFSFFPCAIEDLKKLEQEAIIYFNPKLNRCLGAASQLGYWSRLRICNELRLTISAFKALKRVFGLTPVTEFRGIYYYEQEAISAWKEKWTARLMGAHIVLRTDRYSAIVMRENGSVYVSNKNP